MGFKGSLSCFLFDWFIGLQGFEFFGGLGN